MDVKFFLSTFVSKLIMISLKKLFNRGSNIPGRVALKLDKNILKKLSSNYKVVLVTGTNGKTTTTSMIHQILSENGYDVITNKTGANLLGGVISCFLENHFFKKVDSTKEKWAVIEVDEAYLFKITSQIDCEIIAVTNIFRDQLDRYQELYVTFDKIMNGIKKANNATLVMNGDCSILGGLDVDNRLIYYGFSKSMGFLEQLSYNMDMKFCKFCKSEYKYNSLSYGCLGDFYCDNCGYRRESLCYICSDVSQLDSDHSRLLINGKEFEIRYSGLYNAYNALCSYSVCKQLGIDDSKIHSAINKNNSPFGRGESINIAGKDCKMFLVKNPTGYNEVIKEVISYEQPYACCFILNDNYADGLDVSWIWDVEFEKFKQSSIKTIFVSGSRAGDMAIRLKVALDDEYNICMYKDYNDLIDKIINTDLNKIYFMTTYTAMLEFRKFLYSNKYIENIW